jgi:hypothetical protein
LLATRIRAIAHSSPKQMAPDGCVSCANLFARYRGDFLARCAVNRVFCIKSWAGVQIRPWAVGHVGPTYPRSRPQDPGQLRQTSRRLAYDCGGFCGESPSIPPSLGSSPHPALEVESPLSPLILTNAESYRAIPSEIATFTLGVRVVAGSNPATPTKTDGPPLPCGPRYRKWPQNRLKESISPGAASASPLDAGTIDERLETVNQNWSKCCGNTLSGLYGWMQLEAQS